MKVSRQMINREVRLIGSLLRPLTANVTEEGYRKNKIQSEKKANKLKPKNSDAEKIYLKRADGSQLRLVILKPRGEYKDIPAVLFLHGGGYVTGTPEEKYDFMERLMAASPCVMFAPAYTLAIDKPYPAALDDAYQALLWVKENAQNYGCSSRIIVVGESAGGGLAAALCIKARDENSVKIDYQFPLFPMLDDRCQTDSMIDNDAPIWNVKSNQLAWGLYLKNLHDFPPTAAPSRLTDYSGLPPAYSYVGSIEPFCDETRIYFEKLREAGVAARLDIYEGGFHGFDEIGKNTKLGKTARKRLYAAFKSALEK